MLGCTVPLSAFSTGLRYYNTKRLKTAPLPRKRQGILFSLSNTQPLNATDAEPCSQYLHKNICSAPAANLFLFTLGGLFMTLYGSSIHSSGQCARTILHHTPPPNLGMCTQPSLSFPIHWVLELKSGFMISDPRSMNFQICCRA